MVVVIVVAGAFVAAVLAWLGLTRATMAFAAEIRRVVGPDGAEFDILVNREPVPLFTLTFALANWISVWPIMIGVFRNRGWRDWRWAVTVRRAPFGGRPDLIRDVFDERSVAMDRADALASDVASGRQLWPATREN